jgi:ketosteroid isomerase-like protein
MYAEDAVAYPPSGKPTQGRQAIAALWQGLIDSKGTGFTLATTEVMPAGDRVVETGRYSVTPPNGQPVEGNYLVVWKREGGAWKLLRDIWN